MNSQTIDVTTRDGVADSYLTRPDNAPHPGVLLMIDAIGLRPQIHEMADRIAGQGYVVLAPNLFYRAGRAPLWETPNLANAEERNRFMQTLGPIVSALTPEAMTSDGGSYLDQLAEVSAGPVGITGYCMGGRQGWQIAASHSDRVAALGGFHTGQMVTDADDSPHLRAPEVKATVYWGHADNDHSMSPEQIAALNKAMDDARVPYTTEVYTGAVHGYTMADQGAYNEAAAERHFEALFALLGRTLQS
ncbi:MAG TPA: dienelactone hydrolase family protein [Solirubrobacteraceae bacterium]|jgi:carboxymethylenebutenolidase|nr:dienelactone hydrolase family protein [Solirubrobacteraceae bacterium]